jgi:hypothetical protein
LCHKSKLDQLACDIVVEVVHTIFVSIAGKCKLASAAGICPSYWPKVHQSPVC